MLISEERNDASRHGPRSRHFACRCVSRPASPLSHSSEPSIGSSNLPGTQVQIQHFAQCEYVKRGRLSCMRRGGHLGNWHLVSQARRTSKTPTVTGNFSLWQAWIRSSLRLQSTSFPSYCRLAHTSERTGVLKIEWSILLECFLSSCKVLVGDSTRQTN